MQEYRRKSVIVRAERFWPGTSYGYPDNVKRAGVRPADGRQEYYLKTFGGNVDIEAGDWVVSSEDGCSVCSNDDFQRDYELVEGKLVCPKCNNKSYQLLDSRWLLGFKTYVCMTCNYSEIAPNDAQAKETAPEVIQTDNGNGTFTRVYKF